MQETERLIVPERLKKKARIAKKPVPGVTAEMPDITDPEFANADPEKKGKQMPVPTGYKLLIALPEVEEKTEGGILKADSTKQVEETSTICGFVVSMGSDAYQDKKRFPHGAYCKVGDFVLMRAYSGTRFTVHGKEFRLINDDTVEAVVDDPRGIAKL